MRHSTIRLEHGGRGAAGVQAFAPGRVNLIGEHTDYNDGLCLPFAVARGVTVRAEPLEPGAPLEAHALALAEGDSFPLGQEGDPSRSPEGWRRFVRGAASELGRAGVQLAPCRLEFSGDLPSGAGLSSSAALSVSLCLALCAAPRPACSTSSRPCAARRATRFASTWPGRSCDRCRSSSVGTCWPRSTRARHAAWRDRATTSGGVSAGRPASDSGSIR